jgi:hypothetical protein
VERNYNVSNNLVQSNIFPINKPLYVLSRRIIIIIPSYNEDDNNHHHEHDHKHHLPVIGLDTTYIVENKARTAVVISYINHDGIEVSAKNSQIYPAIHDPNTMLLPGQWTGIVAYEGHVFTVRSIIHLELGMVGPILLQHRIGLRAIGKYFIQQYPNVSCPVDDMKPRIPITNTIHPEYGRT